MSSLKFEVNLQVSRLVWCLRHFSNFSLLEKHLFVSERFLQRHKSRKMYKISPFSRELNYFPILYYLKRMFFKFGLFFSRKYGKLGITQSYMSQRWTTWEEKEHNSVSPYTRGCCRIWLAWSNQAEVIYGLGFIWFHPLLQGPSQWLIGLRVYLQYRWLRFSLWVGKILWRSIFAWRIPTNRGAWKATVHGVAQSRTRLSD